MQTQHLVQASADVITITTLRPGDVYKRLIKRYNDEYILHVGVVQTVDNNGTDVMISAIELGDSSVKHQVFGTGNELAIFAASPAEIDMVVAEMRNTLYQRRSSAERSLEDAREAMDRFAVVESMIDANALQVPATITPAAIQP